MHVVRGILPDNLVSGMYSSLICCCLPGNRHLSPLSCLPICVDPLLRVRRLYQTHCGRYLPFPSQNDLYLDGDPAVSLSYTIRQGFQGTVPILFLSHLIVLTDHITTTTVFKLKNLPWSGFTCVTSQIGLLVALLAH